jgi:hypothetical protein
VRPGAVAGAPVSGTNGALKVGAHDDLVTALGLGVQPGAPRWRAL